MAMTDEKVKEAFRECHSLVSSFTPLAPVRNIDSIPGMPASYSHLLWLALEGPKLIDEGRREKAMRWLGFIQGCIWWGRLSSIEELKNMNRPDERQG